MGEILRRTHTMQRRLSDAHNPKQMKPHDLGSFPKRLLSDLDLGPINERTFRRLQGAAGAQCQWENSSSKCTISLAAGDALFANAPETSEMKKYWTMCKPCFEE